MGINNGVLGMVSISDFNKGKANKIFKDVRKKGAKLVVKHNKVECALVSPEVYEELMEMFQNYNTKNHNAEEALKYLGISKKDIAEAKSDIDKEIIG